MQINKSKTSVNKSDKPDKFEFIAENDSDNRFLFSLSILIQKETSQTTKWDDSFAISPPLFTKIIEVVPELEYKRCVLLSRNSNDDGQITDLALIIRPVEKQLT